MAPKSKSTPKKEKNTLDQDVDRDPNGFFARMVFFLVEKGVQPRRLQIWKQKLLQMGAAIEDHPSEKTTHVLAMTPNLLFEKLPEHQRLDPRVKKLSYRWLEDSLKLGKAEEEDLYHLDEDAKVSGETRKHAKRLQMDLIEGEAGGSVEHKASNVQLFDTNANEGRKKEPDERCLIGSESNSRKRIKLLEKGSREGSREDMDGGDSSDSGGEVVESAAGPEFQNDKKNDTEVTKFGDRNDGDGAKTESLSLYKPPDLNRNITEIFGKLINIYRALGDDRRSFSYYKAIPVIEKLPFKIQSVDQVKGLPSIGKSLQDHIHEIITTGNLSKLEHFENDEKVKTVSLFGEVWGIGPATALKLYEKGYRSLDDLTQESSLTHSQIVGLKFFDDIKKRIPRSEVKDMEAILQKAGEEVLPGVIVVCGGSYRRGKATCGDMDIVITHPDGVSHKGFLPKYVKHLKEMNFLREDLVFSVHSTEGTDSGVDTYFGLCTYPGRELRHRIDLKVYPRDRYAFGLIAWTGNDVLNRRLRLLAESKGFRLDDTGLYLVSKGTGKKDIKANTHITCRTEKEVFDLLGFPWLEPHERNL